MLGYTKKILMIPLMLILLSACAQPVTNAPRISKGELMNERAVQQQMALDKKMESEQRSTQEGYDMQSRLNRIGTQVANAALPVCNELGLNSKNNCIYTFEIYQPKDTKDEPGLNAFADGTKVYVTKSMMRFASDDNELAMILSHEYAHNMMGHVSSQTRNQMMGAVAGLVVDALASSRGIDTQGGFSKMGASAAALRYSKDFEREADYIGMYILARSGREYKNAPALWRRLSVREPNAIYLSTTHPSNPERFVTLEKVIQEIEVKKTSNQPLLPNLKPKA